MQPWLVDVFVQMTSSESRSGGADEDGDEAASKPSAAGFGMRERPRRPPIALFGGGAPGMEKS